MRRVLVSGGVLALALAPALAADPWVEPDALLGRAAREETVRDYVERSSLEDQVRQAHESGPDLQRAAALENLANHHFMRGEFDWAALYYGSAAEIYARTGPKSSRAWVAWRIAEAHRLGGDPAAADAAYESARVEAERDSAMSSTLAEVLLGHARLRASQGDPASARELAERGVEVWEGLERRSDSLADALEFLATTEDALGHPDRARAHRSRADQVRERAQTAEPAPQRQVESRAVEIVPDSEVQVPSK